MYDLAFGIYCPSANLAFNLASAICYLSSTAEQLTSTSYHLPSTVCKSASVIYCLPFYHPPTTQNPTHHPHITHIPESHPEDPRHITQIYSETGRTRLSVRITTSIRPGDNIGENLGDHGGDGGDLERLMLTRCSDMHSTLGFPRVFKYEKITKQVLEEIV